MGRVIGNDPDTKVSFTIRTGETISFDVWSPPDDNTTRYIIRKEDGDILFRFYKYRGSQIVIDYERLKPDDVEA